MGAHLRGACEAGPSRIHLRETIERNSLPTGRVVIEDLPRPALRQVSSLLRQAKIFEHPVAGVCVVTLCAGVVADRQSFQASLCKRVLHSITEE